MAFGGREQHYGYHGIVRRHVPASVWLLLLLGGEVNQVGWLAVIFAAVGSLALLPDLDRVAIALWIDGKETCQGTVTSVRKEICTCEYGTIVRYAHRYRFTLPDGEEQTGISYGRRRVEPATSVTVEYARTLPFRSRIKGMWSGRVRSVVLPFMLLPGAVGLVLLVHGMRRGVGAIRLLAGGQAGLGTLHSKTLVVAPIKSYQRATYRLVFRFLALDGLTYEASCRTEHPERLEDQQQEALVYDPRNPRHAVLLDDLPGSPTIGPDGAIAPASRGAVTVRLLLPVAGLISLTVCALLYAVRFW